MASEGEDIGGTTLADGLVTCPACGGSGRSSGDITVANGCVVCRGRKFVEPARAAAFEEDERASKP